MFGFCLFSRNRKNQKNDNFPCFPSPWSSSVVQEFNVRNIIKMNDILECSWYSHEEKQAFLNMMRSCKMFKQGVEKTFFDGGHT